MWFGVQGGVRVLSNALAIVAGALVGSVLHDRAPHVLHGWIFGTTAGLGALVVVLAWKIFTKLDKILSDTEKDLVRKDQVVAHVKGLRARLFSWGAAAAFCSFLQGGVVVALKDHTFKSDTLIVISGYISLSVIVLATIRLGSTYLSLDDFRLSLVKKIEAEKRRRETLAALRASEILPDVSKSPPLTFVPFGGRAQG